MKYIASIMAAMAIAGACAAEAADFSEREVIVTNGTVVLNGTLTMPETGTPRAALVLATGSGTHDRDETILGHKPFKTIAEHLSANGYAVLRMDDRHWGSTNAQAALNDTDDDYIGDIRTGMRYFDSVYSGQNIAIGVLGHSDGGSMAIRIASADSLCKFIITLAAPAWEGDSIIMSQARAVTVSVAGHWEQEGLQRQLLDIAKGPLPATTAKTMLYTTMAGMLGDAASLPQVQEQIYSQASVMASPWYRAMLRYNPAEDTSKVAVPWLALNGSKDMQVLPGNLETIKSLNSKADCRLLDGLNHCFLSCTTGLPTEYESLPGDIDESVPEIIVEWLDATLDFN